MDYFNENILPIVFGLLIAVCIALLITRIFWITYLKYSKSFMQNEWKDKSLLVKIEYTSVISIIINYIVFIYLYNNTKFYTGVIPDKYWIAWTLLIFLITTLLIEPLSISFLSKISFLKSFKISIIWFILRYWSLAWILLLLGVV